MGHPLTYGPDADALDARRLTLALQRVMTDPTRDKRSRDELAAYLRAAIGILMTDRASLKAEDL